MSEVILELKNISKKFGENYAVKNLSFKMHKGEILGFLGPNGAGKSTTMKMITGFLKPTEGEILFKEKPITLNPLQVKKQIGYLPEQNPLYYDMYVREFLIFIGKLYEIPTKELKIRVEEIITEVGLTPEAHKKIGQLSKGYKQRVGLAHALIANPELIILDEPTSGLDPNQVIEIRNLIKKIGQQKTVLFSSHILTEVEQIADRIIIIHKGEKLVDEKLTTLQQKFEGQEVVFVKFEKENIDLEEIEKHPNCKQIKKVSAVEYEFYVSESENFRKFLFEYSSRQNNAILLLEVEKTSLEQVFKKLTTQ